MSHIVQLTLVRKGYYNLPGGPRPSMPCARRRWKDGSNVTPFRTTKLAAFTQFLSNFMRSKRSIASNLDSKLMPEEKDWISMRKVCAPSSNSFFRVVQIIIRATARITRNTRRFSPFHESQNFPRCNQRWVALTVWDRCGPSTLRCDTKTVEPDRSGRKCAQMFLLILCRNGCYRASLPSPPWKSSRQGVTYSGPADRWARTLSCSRSLNLVPNFTWSEFPSSTNRAASRADPKRSPPLTLAIVTFETVKGHLIDEACGGSYGTR